MSTYKISELIESLQSAKKDGFEFVCISVLEEDDGSETISLEYVVSEEESQEDFIDSVPLPDDYKLDL